ncbi:MULTISPECIES: M23 family metallopeptidase [unclassified Sulfuricurvum]|uniref:M23 family metallopeptidase n=1 Tax=unclassified Sulfuricurvum TaxID=2632390 RepID=UPI0002997D88|nr:MULTISPECIES: M23 family metallopeptidase [unclassified Sulfuricurvum]AFV96419.1 hypothetical protein B649_00525 [Candidatus Sulfuricurvum sp. RIFRC-1]HBM35691.1 M23 family peptidase [Sulfuricurvum sp.]
MRLLVCLLGSFLSLSGIEGYNGKSLVLPLSSASGTLLMNERNISVLPHPINPAQGFAIIPTDYHSPAQEIDIKWINPLGELNIPIEIRSFDYPTEVLNVESSKVTPPPEALQRIAQEKAEAEKIYNTLTPTRYWNKPFIHPMESNITSLYGSARTYNGVLKSYHGGVDFRARTPLPILASNDGIVVLVKDRYYAGGTVIIDHGEGIYSCYFHMSRFDVKVGDGVKRGQSIGLTGATGRITGPHLHFGLMVLGLQSDPLDLITQINALFPKEIDETLTLR